VLKTLYSSILVNNCGAVGGAILTPPLLGPDYCANSTGKIEDIDREPNIQWNYIEEAREVDHLHCSFLYRAGIVDYNLGLSRVAHREETLFTYALKQKGYSVRVVPDAVTWHLKNKQGGIRMEAQSLFDHDEAIFRNHLAASKSPDQTIVVLDNGKGDHVVFSHVLPFIRNPLVYSCYPDIVPGKSIAEAKTDYGDISRYDIYKWMDEHNWTGPIEIAFKRMYGVCDHRHTRWKAAMPSGTCLDCGESIYK
jgi:hypothetical protein